MSSWFDIMPIVFFLWILPFRCILNLQSKGANSTRIEKHDNSNVFVLKNNQTLKLERQFYTLFLILFKIYADVSEISGTAIFTKFFKENAS